MQRDLIPRQPVPHLRQLLLHGISRTEQPLADLFDGQHPFCIEQQLQQFRLLRQTFLSVRISLQLQQQIALGLLTRFQKNTAARAGLHETIPRFHPVTHFRKRSLDGSLAQMHLFGQFRQCERASCRLFQQQDTQFFRSL